MSGDEHRPPPPTDGMEPHPSSPGPTPSDPDEEIPLGQRFFDSPFLLLALGMLIMFVIYTGWGMLEIMSLDPAPLP